MALLCVCLRWTAFYQISKCSTAADCGAVPNANEIHPELADPSLINLKAELLKLGSFINQSSFWTLNRLSKLIVNQQTFFVCIPLHNLHILLHFMNQIQMQICELCKNNLLIIYLEKIIYGPLLCHHMKK